MTHSLCPATAQLSDSNVLFFDWDCIRLECAHCWLNHLYHVLNCPLSNWGCATGKANPSSTPLLSPSSKAKCFPLKPEMLTWNSYQAVDQQLANRSYSAQQGEILHLSVPPKRSTSKFQFVSTTSTKSVFSNKLKDMV